MTKSAKAIMESIKSIERNDIWENIDRIFDDLLNNGIPTINFIENEELDDERIISRKPNKELLVDGKKAELLTINIEILTFKILYYKGEINGKSYVEIYYEDDLVFRAFGSNKWISFKDLGIDDGTMLWKFEKPCYIVHGKWEIDLMILCFCQKAEYELMENKVDNQIEKENKSIKNKWSDLQIKEL
jgi:hypothetical protein